jgi:hypothetical protein
MLSFNKGEWSELYCLLRLMYERQLLGANESLMLTGDAFPLYGGLLKIEASQDLKFNLLDESVSFENNTTQYDFDYATIEKLSSLTLNTIKTNKKRTFTVVAVENFFNQLNCVSLKANVKDKVDLVFKVMDPLTESPQYYGFSVKSFLGASPTLVNASKATNFTFKIGLLEKEKSTFQVLKSKTLCRALNDNKINVVFDKMDSPIYENNLMKIDLHLPLILAELLKLYYTEHSCYIKELVDVLKEKNPLNLKNTELYQDKIMDFLFYSSVGMMPKTPWEGRHDVDGGCLVVQESGDIKTFYFLKKEYVYYFKRYLFEHTFLDTASNRRHGFGSLYEENNQAYLKLNLQIRVKKNENSLC